MADFARNAMLAALAAATLWVTPANAQSASQAQELSNCAGAVGAFARIDPLSFMMPPGAPFAVSPGWTAVMSDILSRLNREEGLEGMTGRYAADAARREWLERPREQQQAGAEECRARFAP